MTTQQTSSAQILMSPVSCIPLSVTEMEEHSHKRDDGSSAVDYTVIAKQCRDSAGRVRIESEVKDRAGNIDSDAGGVAITDPVTGVQTVLATDEKIAFRLTFPKSSGNATIVFTDMADGQDSSHQWKAAQEDAGDQAIQGYSFKGSRTVTSAEDAPNLTTTLSQWYSEQLKLFGVVEQSGPEKSYTIKVKQIQLGEPDSSLFQIPADYKVVDVTAQLMEALQASEEPH